MNTRGAHSELITREHAINLIEAACYSFCIRRPPNLFVTIHCQKAGINASGVHRFLTRFLKLASDWLRARTGGEPPYYVYVLENPPERGMHAHILIHVPQDHRSDFLKRQRHWIKTAGGKRGAGVLCSVDLYFSKDAPYSLDYLERGLKGILLYMLKGLDPVACSEFSIRPKPQGLILGKRCGYSEALGPARRKWTVIKFPKYPKIAIAGLELRRRHLLSLAGLKIRARRSGYRFITKGTRALIGKGKALGPLARHSLPRSLI